jgi:hypothetical protein
MPDMRNEDKPTDVHGLQYGSPPSDPGKVTDRNIAGGAVLLIVLFAGPIIAMSSGWSPPSWMTTLLVGLYILIIIVWLKDLFKDIVEGAGCARGTEGALLFSA